MCCSMNFFCYLYRYLGFKLLKTQQNQSFLFYPKQYQIA